MSRLVVAGAVVVGGRLLLAQRSHPEHLAGLWELPGGKVEASESAAEALRRELVEELGVDIVAGDPVGASVEIADGVHLMALRAELAAGKPRAREHLAIRWVDADELAALGAHGLLVPTDATWLPDLDALLRREMV